MMTQQNHDLIELSVDDDKPSVERFLRAREWWAGFEKAAKRGQALTIENEDDLTIHVFRYITGTQITDCLVHYTVTAAIPEALDLAKDLARNYADLTITPILVNERSCV